MNPGEKGRKRSLKLDLSAKPAKDEPFPRVNRIESGGHGVSIEQLMSSYFALGGSVRVELIHHADVESRPFQRGGVRNMDDLLVGLRGARPGKARKSAAPKKATKSK